MKNIIRGILLASLSSMWVESTGQYCWNNQKTVTTDWQLYNGGAGPGNNDWNWTIQGLAHPVYLSNNLNAPSIFVELPYFCSNPSGSCGNINTYPYELIGNNNQDVKPEDGWEVVKKDFGTPNSTPLANDGYGVSNPYFILYNRFSGRMKLYIANIGVDPGNSAYIRLSFVLGGLSRDLYAHAEPISKALNEFDKTFNFKSINDYAVKNFPDDYYWLVSEVQTSYDPCTCHLTGGQAGQNSSIEALPFIVSTTTITATIEGTFKQKLIDNGSVL